MVSTIGRRACCPTFCDAGHCAKTEIFHMTRATQENAGSPQVRRILRSDDDEAAIAATISRPGAAAHSFTSLGQPLRITKQGLLLRGFGGGVQPSQLPKVRCMGEITRPLTSRLAGRRPR